MEKLSINDGILLRVLSCYLNRAFSCSLSHQGLVQDNVLRQDFFPAVYSSDLNVVCGCRGLGCKFSSCLELSVCDPKLLAVYEKAWKVLSLTLLH